ncbi:MAG: enoyl-CoA hydratase/isomerase family protein [Candidatus Tectomicrobia bacterium]|uniref:Enoyl-CoA hydratase/isomerase family protein n=1 Tax=Tectimicrobiota bacterium TaxID=2528274 RepID=A0A932HZT7_UNCTE|nr:enoyl-CoA hydratase/isomerase family protein [Candidatus Tectomicrobia bacterium]
MPDLLIGREGSAALIRFNRPAVRNAVNQEMMDALDAEVDRLGRDPGLRSVILAGEGREAFCAGGDLKWLQSFPSAEEGVAVNGRMEGILARLAALPVPVIAVLNGYALGGGTEIAFACDLRVMEEHAYLSCRQARIGMMTGWGGGARLLRLVGHGRAMELLATSRQVGAREALVMGLANAVVPRGCGLAEGMRLAAEIAKGGPLAIRAIKQFLIGAGELSLPEAAALESRLFGPLWASEDHREAVRAFIEKRPPVFKGR